MTYIIPTGYSRVSFDFGAISVIGSKPSWGFGVNMPPSDEQVDVFAQWWQDEMSAYTSEGYVLEKVSMRNDAQLCEVLPGFEGADTSPYAPPSVATLVKLTSGLSGRANRGRIYWPGSVPENSINAQGQITPARVEDMQNVFETLAALILVEGKQFQILHSTSSDPTPVTNGRVQVTAATQRRRLRR